MDAQVCGKVVTNPATVPIYVDDRSKLDIPRSWVTRVLHRAAQRHLSQPSPPRQAWHRAAARALTQAKRRRSTTTGDVPRNFVQAECDRPMAA